MTGIGRIAILNRGAAALRLLHAVREYGLAHGRPVQTVILHPPGDHTARYVREADGAVALRAGVDPAIAIDEALAASGADAAWGLGPVAPLAQDACRRHGITWLGAAVDPRVSEPGWLAGAVDLPLVPDPPPPHRLLEAQVVADGSARTWVLGVRDVTLQRPGRPVLVESASPLLSPDEEQVIRAQALRVARTAGLRGVGTVRLAVDPATLAVALCGLDPWLTESHDVTEAVTGLDLALVQLEMALGGGPPLEPPPVLGHALGVAVHAEDPEAAFAPAPGRVALLRLPTGPGIRVDVGTAEGDVLPAGVPAQIARVVARGRTRDEALFRLRHALVDLLVVLEGGITGKAFLLDLLDQPAVRDGTADAAWLGGFAATAPAAPTPQLDVALLVAAADAADLELATQINAFAARARRGKPSVPAELAHTVELHHRGTVHVLEVARLGPVRYRVRCHGVTVDAGIERVGPYESRVTYRGRAVRAVSSMRGAVHLVEVEGIAHRFTRAEPGVVRSPSPGVVVSVPVTVGDPIEPGTVVAVVESMKMESAVSAPVGGVVRRVLVGPNVQVSSGAPLVEISTDGPSVATGAPVLVADPPPTDPHQRCAANAEVLRAFLLGYEVTPADVTAALADQAALADDPAAGPGATEACDRGLLEVFADVRALFRDRPDDGEHDLLQRSAQEYVYAYLRSLDPEAEGLPARFVTQLRATLAHYGVTDLTPGPGLQEALYRVVCSHQRAEAQVPVAIAALERLGRATGGDIGLRDLLDRVAAACGQRFPVVGDLAREVRYRRFDQPLVEQHRARTYQTMEEHLAALGRPEGPAERETHLAALLGCDQPLVPLLLERLPGAGPDEAAVALEVISRRYYRIRRPEDVRAVPLRRWTAVRAEYADPDGGGRVRLLSVAAPFADLGAVVAAAVDELATPATPDVGVLDVFTWGTDATDGDALAGAVAAVLETTRPPAWLRRVVVAVGRPGAGGRRPGAVEHVTFRRTDEGFAEDEFLRGLHPLMAARLRLSRLRAFALERLPAADDVYLFHARARDNPKDERLFALAEVRDLTPVTDATGRVVALPELERVLAEALAGIRQFQAPRPPEQRLHWNRIALHVWPPLTLSMDEIEGIARRLAPTTVGLGLERIVVRCQRPDPATGALRDRVIRMASPSGSGFTIEEVDPPTEPLRPLDEYTQKVVQARRRGLVYPYELVRMVTTPRAGGRADVLGGGFVEHDLDERGALVPVDRPPGRNTAGIVVGVITTVTAKYPEGMERVVLLGDPLKALGSLAEPECRRIIGALDLAEQRRIPAEWFALSSGARIAMDSGTENMDWIAAVLRRIIEFTQRGNELNVVVTGINVGGQPYWNAEATMLMHTKGILVMTPDSAMVLTGKQALDYSGGVSAEDNFGIGGYERTMGPNGQAQYWAPDLTGAIGVLLAHYDHAYVAPGERFPRQAPTVDPVDRDVRPYPHRLEGSPFTTVGEILSPVTNPERKLPFDIRTVMRAVADQDHEPLERWPAMRDAETAVVWDAHLGGHPVLLLGFESHTLRRTGVIPADGPERWTSGTLFPQSSKKVARAINAANGNRPLVVLANLSGFDGSPDSMRSLQLEYGAEIGRAVVNFRGPIVFCVISRYHGGAFVVFSGKLHDNMETLAIEGSRASVIGGAPAAAVVFANEVAARTRADPRVAELEAAAKAATGAERARLRAALAEVTAAVRSEKLGEVAAEFDRVHSVERALAVGSVDAIIPAAELRPRVIAALERGMARELARLGATR